MREREKHNRGKGRPHLQLEEGVLPGRDAGCIQHKAQGIGDEEASLLGTEEVQADS